MKHGLSIDVEDYYQVLYQDHFGLQSEPTPEVEHNTHWLLDTLAAAGVKATFFLLGNVARTFPALVARIAQEGHEIGIHGFDHKYIHRLQPGQFRDEIDRTLATVHDAAGVAIIGHRAPTFSITETTCWAFDVLLAAGFEYDSSIYPVKGARYGIPDAKRTIYTLPNGLIQIPLSCIDLFGKRLPAAGGGYIRHFPYWWTRYVMRRLAHERRPANVYMHPYEFEPSYPAVDRTLGEVTLKLRLHTLLQSHNRGKKQRGKLQRMLRDFEFVPLRELLVERA